jgi:HK97 family phage prohead protease
MKPEIKTFEFKVEDADSKKGIIRGFASTFGNIDFGDDVVDAGAFKKTIQETRGLVPILADHDPSKPIGWNVRAEETEKGLFVEGQINLKTQLGKDRYEIAQQALEVGAKMGLSIGYGVIKAMPDKERPAVRRLKEIKLYEYSLVIFPMNNQAMVTAAKSWQDVTATNIVDMIFEKANALGVSPDVIAGALLKKHGAAPATIKDDPALDQSLDRFLKTLTEGVK